MFILQVFDAGIFVFRFFNGRERVTGIKTHNILKNIFIITSVFTENMLFLGFKVYI
jgi:hypothetical protein